MIVLIPFLIAKDAYKITLTYLFSFIGSVQILLGVLSPTHYENNWYFITIVALFFIEITLLIVIKLVLNKIK